MIDFRPCDLFFLPWVRLYFYLFSTVLFAMILLLQNFCYVWLNESNSFWWSWFFFFLHSLTSRKSWLQNTHTNPILSLSKCLVNALCLYQMTYNSVENSETNWYTNVFPISPCFLHCSLCVQLACCCGSAACSCCCNCCPKIKQSTGTRIMYALYFLLVTIICVIMMSPTVEKELKEKVST